MLKRTEISQFIVAKRALQKASILFMFMTKEANPSGDLTKMEELTNWEWSQFLESQHFTPILSLVINDVIFLRDYFENCLKEAREVLSVVTDMSRYESVINDDLNQDMAKYVAPLVKNTAQRIISAAQKKEIDIRSAMFFILLSQIEAKGCEVMFYKNLEKFNKEIWTRPKEQIEPIVMRLV